MDAGSWWTMVNLLVQLQTSGYHTQEMWMPHVWNRQACIEYVFVRSISHHISIQIAILVLFPLFFLELESEKLLPSPFNNHMTHMTHRFDWHDFPPPSEHHTRPGTVRPIWYSYVLMPASWLKSPIRAVPIGYWLVNSFVGCTCVWMTQWCTQWKWWFSSSMFVYIPEGMCPGHHFQERRWKQSHTWMGKTYCGWMKFAPPWMVETV